MTKDYSKGKIYVIKSDLTDKVYIGSTIEKYLSSRMAKHKNKHKRWRNGIGHYYTCFELFELDPNCYIKLLENFPCSDINELEAREGFHQKNNDKCVNKRIEGRTYKEWYEENKEILLEKQKIYNKLNYEKSRELKKEYNKQYYAKNKEKICSYQKQNELNNKEKRKEQKKQYYFKNKEVLLEKSKEKTKCDCGSTICKNKVFRHKKSKRHVDWENKNLSEIESVNNENKISSNFIIK